MNTQNLKRISSGRCRKEDIGCIVLVIVSGCFLEPQESRLLPSEKPQDERMICSQASQKGRRFSHQETLGLH